MKAMVLAAGLGTRLGALTQSRPKALMEVAGKTLLEITLAHLRSFGVTDVIINVHHFADMIVDYLKSHANFGLHIEFSREDVLLDTGGGLKQASDFFLDDRTASDKDFVLHNVDVVSSIDIRRMADEHRRTGALATLAVQKRASSRYFLFDESATLCGWQGVREQRTEMARTAQHIEAVAFSGIHIISPRLLTLMEEEGAFSIVRTYLRLAAAGERILAFRADEYYWRDLGKPEDLAEAAVDFANNRIPRL